MEEAGLNGHLDTQIGHTYGKCKFQFQVFRQWMTFDFPLRYPALNLIASGGPEACGSDCFIVYRASYLSEF
jgi:hypothetical protein